MTEVYQLCQKLTGLHPTEKNCFNYTLKTCRGACIKKEPISTYNARVQELISKSSFENKSFALIDKGREIDERCAILVENGIFKGITFYHLNFQVNNIDVLRSLITPMQNNRDVQHIIKNYMRKNKKLKIIQF